MAISMPSMPIENTVTTTESTKSGRVDVAMLMPNATRPQSSVAAML